MYIGRKCCTLKKMHMNQYRIFCFGDSITYGAWDPEGGWADMLRRYFHKSYLAGGVKAQVFNLGIGGEMSDGLLMRIENEILARLKPSWIPVIIIATGKNDSKAQGTPENYSSNPEAYRGNLINIVNIAKKYSNNILMVGLGISNEKLSFKDLFYTNKRFKLFDEVNEDVATALSIPRVELHERMLMLGKCENFFEDSAHPNNIGHTWLFEQILPQVKELLD